VAAHQKKAVAEGRTLVFVDQSGFYLLPGMVRTYAPVGETPIIRAPWGRDHLSAMSGITPQGQLYMLVQERSYCGEDVVRFLDHLLRHISGKVLVLWDGASIHRCQAVKDYLAEGAAARIHLERFPSYAPELNPDEGIWHYLKGVELKNLCCRDLAHLRQELRKAKERLRHKTDVILGCIRQPGLV
jgi:transposase